MLTSEEIIHIGTNKTWKSAHPLGIQGGVRSILSPWPQLCMKI